MRWLKVILLSFFFGIFGGIFSSQILWPHIERFFFYQHISQAPSYLIIQRKEIEIKENTALKDAIEKVKKSSFFVESQIKEKKISGSGFVLTSDGLAVTLADLVPLGGKFNFFVEGNSVPFQILKRDLKNNLALIKFEGKNFSSSGFSSIEKLRLGEKIFLVANFRKDKNIDFLVDEGIVKSFDKDFIETSFQKNKRISGAPAFDIEGNFLGLVFIKDQKVLAIPVDKIKEFSGF